MDIDGNGLVTLEEMLATVGQCRQISYTLTTEDGIALQDVLAKVVASVRKHSVSMFDPDDLGRSLVPPLAKTFLLMILPSKPQHKPLTTTNNLL